jgi:hypothetical protein
MSYMALQTFRSMSINDLYKPIVIHEVSTFHSEKNILQRFS